MRLCYPGPRRRIALCRDILTAVCATMVFFSCCCCGFLSSSHFLGVGQPMEIRQRVSQSWRSAALNQDEEEMVDALSSSTASYTGTNLDPLMLRAARGEKVERTPVWMMRQAGRHMQCYRDLAMVHKTFRERSETPEIATEISLQPWKAYKTDGVILFSDILTVLHCMGKDFQIQEKVGPVVEPVRTEEALSKMISNDPATACPFVGESLKYLRNEVGNTATVIGFVGLPWTLATYLVEGQSSKDYPQIKQLMFRQPEFLHKLLDRIASSVGDYANYQIQSGAQVIQVFDSWAGCLSPRDYDVFAAPYQRAVIRRIKAQHPETPIILYIKQSGALLERMAASGADIVSLDWTVTIPEARARIGNKIGIQGNLDPAVLLGPKEIIKERTEEILQDAVGNYHIMNLGHGIDAFTPEENAKYFVDCCVQWNQRK
eukprot:492262_1